MGDSSDTTNSDDDDEAYFSSSSSSSAGDLEEHHAPDMFEGDAAGVVEDLWGAAQSVALIPPPKGSVVCRNTNLSLNFEDDQCGIVYYLCPYCKVQFPIREFNKKAFRRHLVKHMHYVVYRCTAVSLWCTPSRTADHERHPALINTTITDVVLDRHKLAAYALRSDLAVVRPNMFPYVDVLLVDKNVHVICCAYCCYTTKKLCNFKHHVVTAHVLLEFPFQLPPYLLPSVKGFPPGAEHPGLVVFGPPHVL